MLAPREGGAFSDDDDDSSIGSTRGFSGRRSRTIPPRVVEPSVGSVSVGGAVGRHSRAAEAGGGVSPVGTASSRRSLAQAKASVPRSASSPAELSETAEPESPLSRAQRLEQLALQEQLAAAGWRTRPRHVRQPSETCPAGAAREAGWRGGLRAPAGRWPRAVRRTRGRGARGELPARLWGEGKGGAAVGGAAGGAAAASRARARRGRRGILRRSRSQCLCEVRGAWRVASTAGLCEGVCSLVVAGRRISHFPLALCYTVEPCIKLYTSGGNGKF